MDVPSSVFNPFSPLLNPYLYPIFTPFHSHFLFIYVAMERARLDHTSELESLIEEARKEGVNVVSAELILLDLEHEKRRIEGIVSNLQVQHTLLTQLTHPIITFITPYQHTLSIHLIDTFITHSINTPSRHPLLTHSFHTPYQHNLSTHSTPDLHLSYPL